MNSVDTEILLLRVQYDLEAELCPLSSVSYLFIYLGFDTTNIQQSIIRLFSWYLIGGYRNVEMWNQITTHKIFVVGYICYACYWYVLLSCSIAYI